MNIKFNLNNKAILITGGTGSFGQKCVGEILKRFKPSRLVVFSRDEQKQYEMKRKFREGKDSCLRYFIGDVRDQSRLEMALSNIEYVIHAAALKHVPTAEYNPFECIQTNVHGAENLINAALRQNVKRVIALSTDKAVAPINLYGASKLAAEKIFVAGNNLSKANSTQFSIVRYGNVLGSRGSVIPHFVNLVKTKGKKTLPLTDLHMTRFWITLTQGVEFVLNSLGQMQGGEIFVPKIPSMEVAKLIKCFGLDIKAKVIGIRPGEKIHETLITNDEARNAWDMGSYYLIEPDFVWRKRKKIKAGTTKTLPKDFSYASNTNKKWIKTSEMKKIVENIKNAKEY